jgi:hypothetical protein
MEENMIYALTCPITKRTVYVGKTKKGLERPYSHLDNKSHSEKINRWVSMLKSEGREPIIVILDQGSNDDITNQKEVFWVNYFIKKGEILLNDDLINTNHLQLAHIKKISNNDEDPLAEIRTYVKLRRKILKLTQKELASKSGVGIRFLRELEQGTKHNFNTESIVKVLKLIGNGKLTVSV